MKTTRRSILGVVAGVNCIEAIEAGPIEAGPLANSIEAIEATHAVRRVIADQIRSRLTQLHRYCAHDECWDLALQNIRSGADHITFAPCCHDYPRNQTYYRVVAEWIKLGEYGVEAVRVQPGRGWRK